MPFWKFSWNRPIGWNGHALLVQPSISAHRKWKWSTVCGSYESLGCLERWISNAYSFRVQSGIKTVWKVYNNLMIIGLMVHCEFAWWRRSYTTTNALQIGKKQSEKFLNQVGSTSLDLLNSTMNQWICSPHIFMKTPNESIRKIVNKWAVHHIFWRKTQRSNQKISESSSTYLDLLPQEWINELFTTYFHE